MAKWSMDLNKYVKDKETEIKDVRKAYAFGLYSSIVEKTPAHKQHGGRARGNWNISAGSVDTSTSNATKPKYTSPSSVPEPKGDEPIYISNNLPYITTLEYGGYPDPVEKGTWIKKGKGKGHYEKLSENGFSKQAPEGMVGVTLANNRAIFDSAVRSVKK